MSSSGEDPGLYIFLDFEFPLPTFVKTGSAGMTYVVHFLFCPEPTLSHGTGFWFMVEVGAFEFIYPVRKPMPPCFVMNPSFSNGV